MIVGGGGAGSALAYFLMTLAGISLRVVAYERDPSYAYASTTLAAGGIRQQFSTPENVLMSRFGFEFMSQAGIALATAAGSPDIGLKPLSYLRLASKDDAFEIEAQVDMQRRLGANPRLLDRKDLCQLFPWMRFEDVDLGVLGGDGEGQFNATDLSQGLRRKAIDLGARFEIGEVRSMERDRAGRVTTVVLADGQRTACRMVVNAAGPWAGSVARMAGIEIPVVPTKAQSFAFRVQDPPPNCPIVLDHVGLLHFKPEGAQFVAARRLKAVDMPATDFDVDYSLFDELVWPALAQRASCFEAIKVTRGWVGHIDLNSFDQNALLGPAPGCPNFIQACGFSGHGAQHLPAIGRAIAELIVYGEFRTIDLSRLSCERLATGERLTERV